ncbi:NAD(+)/NADH kinase [Candidatus Peregrinibacteria bacterium]|nr:NAD(+)/NADH kinase [Candidatus Peregrinibacteria bacterium]
MHSPSSKMNKIGISTRWEMKHPEILEHLISCLLKSDKEIFLSEKSREHLLKEHTDLKDISDMPKNEKLDLLIVLGGDGTILSSIRKLSSFNTYIFGINAGDFGFLSEVPPMDLEDTCTRLWNEDYTIDERMLLSAEIRKKSGKKKTYLALNEVVISQSTISRLINLPTKIDGVLLTSYRADGLILATPTGSTAYNLSAGGPIVHPRVQAFILTPIAPFSLTQKPVVVPADKTVSLEIVDCNRDDTVITFDGQIHESLACGDTVHIQRYHETAKFLRFPEERYFTTLRKKLKWGEGGEE